MKPRFLGLSLGINTKVTALINTTTSWINSYYSSLVKQLMRQNFAIKLAICDLVTRPFKISFEYIIFNDTLRTLWA